MNLTSQATDMADPDLYDLLSLDPSCTQKQLDSAYRHNARRWHPDKTGNNPSDREKFDLVCQAYDILSEPTTKAKYDNARAARLQKIRQAELFEGRRRQMRDDLEARERGVKRGRDDNDQENMERTFRQLAEDGKRMRLERQDALKKEMELENAEGYINSNSPMTNGASSVPELDRTVKVRWPIEDGGDMVKESDIASLFSAFGKVGSVTLLEPKAQKKKKQLVAICMVQYVSIVGAHAAVKDFPKQKGKEWQRFDLVFWAGNKEPDSISEQHSDITNARYANAPASPSTPAMGNQSPAAFLDRGSQPATPTPLGSALNGHGPRKMPSFPSFSAAAFNSPRGSPSSRVLGVNSPSLEELTMIRLKNAEKKRLADELQREDDVAAPVPSLT